MTPRQLEELGERMLKAYSEAEQEMLRAVAKRLARGVEQPGWTEQKAVQLTQMRRELEGILERVHNDGREIMADSVTAAYGDEQQRWMLDHRDFVAETGLKAIHPNADKVAAILSELTDKVDAAERTVLRRFDDQYAGIIGETSALVATGGFTYREALQESMRRFADAGITGFTDQAGKHWELSTYAEMALLTAVSHASVQGYTDTMRAYGMDLVIVDDHAGACPLCEPWQGCVLSVSGGTPGYHTLAEAEDAGLFHPRCLCTVDAYQPEIDQGPVRTEPGEVKEPNEAYTARSTQRYIERQIRRYKNRMAAATTAQAERQAYNKVRDWQAKMREHLNRYQAETLPRKYWREGGRVTLRLQ